MPLYAESKANCIFPPVIADKCSICSILLCCQSGTWAAICTLYPSHEKRHSHTTNISQRFFQKNPYANRCRYIKPFKNCCSCEKKVVKCMDNNCIFFSFVCDVVFSGISVKMCTELVLRLVVNRSYWFYIRDSSAQIWKVFPLKSPELVFWVLESSDSCIPFYMAFFFRFFI